MQANSLPSRLTIVEVFPATTELAYRFISELSEVQATLQVLERETIIGLDTETYWERPTNRPCLSLVQIATGTGEVVVIDLLAVNAELLHPIVDSATVMMAAHNAHFDQRVLTEAGLNPAALVDTLRLARSVLQLPSYSLAALAEHLFGITLNKSLQKSNWGRRPLTNAQLIYAATDARTALRLFDELRKRVNDQRRWNQLLHEALAGLYPFRKQATSTKDLAF